MERDKRGKEKRNNGGTRGESREVGREREENEDEGKNG